MTKMVQNQEAVIEFFALPTSLSSVGHAYIKRSREDQQKQSSTFITYGFYPYTSNKFFMVERVKGEVKNENELEKPPSISISVSLNTKELELVLNTIKKWELETNFEFKKYSLTSQNCINFINNIALIIDLITPETKLKLPTQYISELAKLNKSS
mgnify:FL=1